MSAPVVEIEEIAADECPECLAGNLNWLLTQAHYTFGRELAAAFEPLGITPRGHSVLVAAIGGKHTQKELSELIGLDKTTMVVTLDELEAAGLAKRVPSPVDRRARVVEVTAAGNKKIRQANEIAARIQTDVLSSLGDTDAGDALMETLGRLIRTRGSDLVTCKGIRRREPR
ncbi:MAG TPA: MarR family winged helix-turn-helix transcriptional regulator [Solirubrobacteraceae bacterium]|nr:MarR family winged helix-turn-helix transcriptional regulator [Solirubrobacteraceae bacterium]